MHPRPVRRREPLPGATVHHSVRYVALSVFSSRTEWWWRETSTGARSRHERREHRAGRAHARFVRPHGSSTASRTVVATRRMPHTGQNRTTEKAGSCDPAFGDRCSDLEASELDDG